MAKQKSTKRALIASGLALFMCISMFVGSTFAWFTDSVKTGVNTIQAGTLDIVLEYKDANGVWQDAEGKTLSFKAADNRTDILWEPGCTYELPAIRVRNNGNLALKYEILINGITGDAKLLEAIDFTANGSAIAGFSGELTAKDQASTPIVIKGHMKEIAGNEYMGLTIEGIGITVYATQYTYEKDSISDQYDVNATFLNKDADGAWLINNMDELFFFATDVNRGNDYYGQTVKLTADIDLSGYAWTPIGSGSVNGQWIGFNGIFDGQGHTISNVKVAKSGGWNGIFGLVGRGTSKFTESISNLTVKNFKIEEANRMTGAVVGQLYGNIENCHVENVDITAVPNWEAAKNQYDNGDKIGGVIGWFGDNGNNHYIKGCTAKNVTLKAYRDVGGIVGYIGQTTTVENCAVDTVTVVVDQKTNSYGEQVTNAGGVVGRIAKQPVTIQNNTETNVSLHVPTYVSTVDDLKDIFATESDGAVIYLKAGTYDGLSFVNPASYKVKNLTIIGEEGTVIDGMFFAGEEGGWRCDIDGLTIKNVTFSGGISLGSVEHKNILIEGCKFIDNSCIKHVASAGETIKNLVVRDCKFDGNGTGSNTAIMLEDATDVTVEGCEFNNIQFNVIQGGKLYGTVLIDNNKINKTGDRVFRFVTVNADMTISNNTIVSDGDSDGELAKATNAVEITLTNNTWNGASDAAVAAKLINITAK